MADVRNLLSRAAMFRRAEAAIHDAVFDPDRWQPALQMVAAAADAVGAVLIVRENRTKMVQRMDLVGSIAPVAGRYLEYYSKLDPFITTVEAGPANRLLRLSETVAPGDLRANEWYNDFVLRSGVGDMLGCRIHETNYHTVVFGTHEAIGRAEFTPQVGTRLGQLLRPIGRAMRLQQQMHEAGWQLSVARRSLDHLSAGVLISDAAGRVVEMNAAAEWIMGRDDGLTVRQGRLAAGRAFETAKLMELLFGAAGTADAGAIGRMPVRRPGGRPPYLLTVAPLGPDVAGFGRKLALTLIVDPDARLPTEGSLAEMFGLSPAESRLAKALVSGKMLREAAADLGVEITTLRTQLRSIFRKVGVSRQADLMRILTNIPGGSGGFG